MRDLEEEQLKDGRGASGEWLTVKETAERLQVSERTIKRRLASGEWETRFEPLQSGGRKRLLKLPAQRPNEEAKSDSARDGERDTGPSASKLESDTKGARVGTSDSARDTSEKATSGPNVAALVAERDIAKAEVERLRNERDREREEVLFLRARVAELNAIVMQTARALPSQTQERPAIEAAPVSSPVAPGQTSDAPAQPRERPAPQTSEKRPARPLWALILGIRPKA
jgi:cell division protein FtsN